jgi:hypothetical protein
VIFHGPVWAPARAGPGQARISLTYPGLEDWNVLPTTLEAPVEGPGLSSWLWLYGPWCLGAALVAAAVWLVVRYRFRQSAPNAGTETRSAE